MSGKPEPSTIRSRSPASRGRSSGGSGIRASVNGVQAMVVSRCTLGYRSARARCSAYSGMPRCAITAVRVGCRRSTSPNGPGPVCRPGTGPEPQCTTPGTPAGPGQPAPDRVQPPGSRVVAPDLEVDLEDAGAGLQGRAHIGCRVRLRVE